jgi:hypothetical protein
MAENVKATSAKPESRHAGSGLVRHVYQDADGNDVTRYGLRVDRDRVVWLGPAEDSSHLELEAD